MTRTFAYGLHRKKLILLGKWPYSSRNENCFPPQNRITNDVVSGEPGGCLDVPGMARGEDPCDHPYTTSYDHRVHYQLFSPTNNCAYQPSRHGTPASLIKRYARQSVARGVHHERIECDHDRSQHVRGGGCAGDCGFTGG